jgi:hypothetical protein
MFRLLKLCIEKIPSFITDFRIDTVVKILVAVEGRGLVKTNTCTEPFLG